MNNFLKTAHAAGVSQALQDFGITKTAESETLTKALSTVPVYGPVFGGLSAAAFSPEDRGVSRAANTLIGSALGQLGGGAAGTLAGGLAGIPLAALLSLVSKGKIKPEHTVMTSGGTGMAGGMLYGGWRGAESGLEESRRGDTLLEQIRDSEALESLRGLVD